MTPENFPLLLNLNAGTSRYKRLVKALEDVCAGIVVGSIRNVTLNDSKEVISRATEHAWEKGVREPFTWREGEIDAEALQLYFDISVSGIHDITFLPKKLSRTRALGPAVDAMRSICEELLPLALAIKDLKTKTIKGRAPSAGDSKPVNPNKVVMTCPCCFRSIAVMEGHMAHHGYRRPGHGLQTCSCPGIRFKPLEVSREGLDWLINTKENTRDHLLRQLDDKLASTMTLIVKREVKTFDASGVSTKRVIETQCSVDEPGFEAALAHRQATLSRDLKHLEHELVQLRLRQALWKPKAA